MNCLIIALCLQGEFKMVEVKAVNPEDYEGVVFSGMGGSGIVGDFIKTFF